MIAPGVEHAHCLVIWDRLIVDRGLVGFFFERFKTIF